MNTQWSAIDRCVRLINKFSRMVDDVRKSTAAIAKGTCCRRHRRQNIYAGVARPTLVANEKTQTLGVRKSTRTFSVEDRSTQATVPDNNYKTNVASLFQQEL